MSSNLECNKSSTDPKPSLQLSKIQIYSSYDDEYCQSEINNAESRNREASSALNHYNEATSSWPDLTNYYYNLTSKSNRNVNSKAKSQSSLANYPSCNSSTPSNLR